MAENTGSSIQNPDLTTSNSFPIRSGYQGAVVYETSEGDFLIRTTSCTMVGSQEITAVDDIDGSIDKTRYYLQPFRATGAVDFHVDQSNSVDTIDLFNIMFRDAVKRQADGRLWTRGKNHSLLVRYYPGLVYRFIDVAINKMTLSLDTKTPLKVSVDMMARGRSRPDDTQTDLGTVGYAAPVRVITFNDVSIGVESDTSELATNTREITKLNAVEGFSLVIDNQLEEVFTVSGDLTPYDLVAKKRNITGSINFYGRSDELADFAEAHELYPRSSVTLAFIVRIGNSTVTLFRLTGVIFKLDNLQITNNVLKSTMNFIALGNQNFGYEGISGLGTASNEGFNEADGHPYPF
jgi:hypothetical protein